MPKSKEIVSSSDSDSDSGGKAESKAKKRKSETQESATPEKKKSSGTKGPNGERMFEIGRMRYATVSEFKGKTLVSIREYYMTDSGDLRPGKKGISLSTEQWKTFKDIIPDLDQAVKDM